MQVIAGPESAFDAALFPTHSSHLCCHERAGWGRQNKVCPRALETLGMLLYRRSFVKVGVGRSNLRNLLICTTSTAVICVTIKFSQAQT